MPKRILDFVISNGRASRDPIVVKAYNCWATQRKRCNNPNSQDYYRYGARGIKVHYKSGEFVTWYLKEYRKKNWVFPTVGRLDHDGDYCFENIIMQEMRENVQERLKRCGNSEIPIDIYHQGILVVRAKSLREAEKISGISGQLIKRLAGTGVETFKERFRFENVKTARSKV